MFRGFQIIKASFCAQRTLAFILWLARNQTNSPADKEMIIINMFSTWVPKSVFVKLSENNVANNNAG